MSPNFDHVIVLADESANWEIAGLRQLERLVLALEDLATSISSRRKIDIFIFWRPDIAANERWRPENSRLTRCKFVETLTVGGRERVFNTRLLLKRRGLEQFVHDSVPLENDATIGDESVVWEKLWHRFENACAETDPQRSEIWRYLSNDRAIERAERWLLRGSGKSQDGFVSRFLNRPISRSVTRVLLRFPITPTGWTISIFPLLIVASLFLLRGDYLGFVIGCAIFQIYSILDGCDGEIARAKFWESEAGARLDTFCDSVGNVLFALGLGFGLQKLHHGWQAAEGMICAAALAANEWILSRSNLPDQVAEQPFYPRHRAMLQRAGLSSAKGGLFWWIFQLTKHDVAIFVFLLLAIADLPNWILHLWASVAVASLLLTLGSRLRAS